MYVAPPTLLHPEGLSGGRRLSVLTIQAGQWSIAGSRIELDWSLKSAREPFDGLAELLGELGLAEHASRRYTLDVVALPPVEVWTRSAVRGENATIGIWIPKGLNKGPASLHYRVRARNAPTVRASLSARQLAWMRDENANVGAREIRVPRGAVINCVASYASVGHHSYWFADPAQIPNPRLQALTATECPSGRDA
jgi:hypothetical protein